MFNRELIRELRATVERQQAELTALRSYNEKLVERLLQNKGVAPLPPPVESSTTAEIERLLSSTDIFGEDEIEITDNRKEQYSEFAS